MRWNFPVFVEINEKEYAITKKCDYRVVLGVITILNDEEFTKEQQIYCALNVFYEDLEGCTDLKKAVEEMYKIISYGEENRENEEKPRLMDWDKDFNYICSSVNKILGYDIRDPEKYTHWYTLLAAYSEIREGLYADILNIRIKKSKGKPLEKWEREFYAENKDIIDLPLKLTDKEKEWLDGDW